MSAMQITSQNTVNLAMLSPAQSIDAKQQTVDASKILSDIAVDKKKQTAAIPAGSGAITLRQPDNGATMPVNDLLMAVERRVMSQTPLQSLAQLAGGADSAAKAKGFDVANLKTNNVAALFAVIQQALQTAKTAERQNQADMAIVKGQMADGAANAMRAAGQAALSGAVGQAAFGLSISGAGFGLQQKGINRERSLLKNDQATLIEQRNALNIAKFSGVKGSNTPQDVASAGRSVRLNTTEGSTVAVRQNTTGVQPRHEAHIKEAAEAKLERQIGFSERDLKDKQAKAEATKAKGMLVSQMAHPTTGVVGGNTQVMQANENAQQHLHQQAGQVADGLADASNVSARDFESLIQTLAQKLADIQRAHLDTAGMIAGKSV